MIIRILVIFLITLTPINTTPCTDNPTCKCTYPNLGELNIICDINNSTGFNVIIKARNNIEIICRNWKTWENFNVRGRLSEALLKSLSFKKCGLSNDISLKDLVRQLGIKGTETLIFKSFQKLSETLKKYHIRGFQGVKSLILSNNGLINIPNDLLFDYPQLEYIDLSHNHFRLPIDIFNATPNLKQIELVFCGIDTIHVGTFNKLRNLESLNMMSNYLEEIKPGTFDYLIFLRSLNLANNLLFNLTPTIFHGLKNLERLDISVNNFSSIPSELFDQNKQLKELYLHSNIKKLNTLPDNLLANLTMLSKVHLNNNGFTFLPENLFWNSSPLRYIYLNDNSLVTLPKKIFRDLKNVKHLFLNNNKINTLPDKIFVDMENLETLDLSNNLFVRVSRDLFFGLFTLLDLNMERNRLQVIDNKSLLTLINLTHARFSHNPLKLNYISKILSVFHSNQYLTDLYLSNCSIENFFDDWTSGNNNLKLLDLSHNLITNVTETLFILPLVDITIDLSYNKIRNIRLDKIKKLLTLRKETRKIVINLGNNPLFCDCPLYDLLRYRDRKMSPFLYNNFYIKFGYLTCLQPDGKHEIDISTLNSQTYVCPEHEYFKTKKLCQDNCTCYVRPSNKTRILDCSYKNISKFLIDNNKVLFVRNSPIIIDLTGNFLTDIPSTEPLSPMNVTGLLLSNNNISTITLDNLPSSLKELELHNNHISFIYYDVLEYLKSKSLEKLTLSGNPIKCECSNKNIYYFVQSHRNYYKDLDHLKCEDSPLRIHEIEDIEKLCSSPLLWCLLVSLLLVIIITTVVFIIFNKQIMLWFARKRAEYSVYFTQRNEPEN